MGIAAASMHKAKLRRFSSSSGRIYSRAAAGALLSPTSSLGAVTNIITCTIL